MTEDGDHQRAEDPAQPVHGEDIKRVVDAGVVLDEQHRLLADDARDGPDHQRLERADIPRGRCDRSEARNRACDHADQRGAAELDAFPQRPAQRGGRGRDMRDKNSHGRRSVRRQRRSAVEAEPADPQHRGTDRHIARIVRRRRLVQARPQQQRQYKRGKPCGLMHNDAARKVLHAILAKDPARRQEPAAPDPVGDRRIDQQHPQGREQQHEAKADPFDIGAHDQGRGDDSKGHLEGDESHLGDGAESVLAGQTDQHGASQPAPIGVVCAEGDGIARDQPKNAHQCSNRKAVHEHAQHIARADKAAVKKGKAR